ncbi:hypothetical protein [Streptosporangium carneum]|uniref:ABC transporter n=1 Tax=Streptosporangium carneum TaxID=47481 RepID=A0A9W6IBV4_9ACTN|nr:hypothetical protein [Streptosporangium carneum]GLK14630.1 ABC transporter [Streptosporangium carneum]
MTVAMPGRLPAAKRSDGGLKGAVASEWTKFWSVRGTMWTLLAGTALLLGGVALAAISTRSQHEDGTTDAFTSSAPFVGATAVAFLAQWAVAVLGVMVITSEYSTGTIRATTQWVPNRGRVLLAKVLLLVPVLFVLGLVFGGAALILSDIGLGEYGEPYTDAAAYDTVIGIALYMPMLGVFALGLGTLLRNVAGAISVLFVILLIVPILLPGLNLGAIADYLPGDAGANLMRASTGEPYGQAVGGLIMLGWTLASIYAGYVTLRSKDA